MVAIEALETLSFFSSLEPEERALLAAISERKHYSAGSVLFREGQEPGALLVLMSGHVSLRQGARDDGPASLMAAVGAPGSVFGIAALIGQRHIYPHSAICLEDTEVIEVDGEKLMELCREKPVAGFHIVLRLTQVLAERLSAAREQIRSRIRPGLISHG